MNDLEQKELELRKQSNKILDNFLAKKNEEEKKQQEFNLMLQAMNQKKMENFLIKKMK